MDYSLLSPKRVMASLKTDPHGLSSRSVTERIGTYGVNTLERTNRLGWLRKLVAPFKSAFVLLLVVGAGISWAIGHRADAYIISIVVIVNALIEWGQSVSASRISKSLQRYSALKTQVKRSGKLISIDSQQLVPGDVVLINEGDKVAADGRIISAHDFSMDESILTGESAPRAKSAATLKRARPIYEQSNMLFRGTTCAAGRAVMVVTSTGRKTAFGQIANLASGEQPKPPIYEKIRKLTFYLVSSTLLIAVVVILLGLNRGEDLPTMFRFAVALIVSVIPEGLPVTLTVIFLVGIQKMAKNNAFVRNLTAVETLGMVTAIATDKTGTLTHNRLEIAKLWDLDGKISEDDYAELWLSVSHNHPDRSHPIERLITEYTEAKRSPISWHEVEDLPFNTARRVTKVLWVKQGMYRIYVKGAPEVVLEECVLSKTQDKKISIQLNKLTRSGVRVVAIARENLNKKPPRLSSHMSSKLEFVGLVGFREKLRKEAKDAISATREAGIEVYMVTGDHLRTAQAIGQDVGIARASQVSANGQDIADANAKTMRSLIQRVRVFGRVLPEHKYKLLKSLKSLHITAMTGDGVNDVPALTQADVGIAMGSGTEAAKESADIVLLDDNYATIVAAIKAGRTIYANVRKMVYYLLTTNLAEALTVIIGLVVGLPLPLTAAQILWLNLVTDTTMVIPLGLEPAEANFMRQKPRHPLDPLLSRHLVVRMALMVMVMSVSSIIIFNVALPRGLAQAQTMAFASLSIVQWTSAINTRNWHHYSWQNLRHISLKLAGGIVLSLLLVGLVIYGPLSEYMGTEPPEASMWAWLIFPCLLTALVSDLYKYTFRHQTSEL